MKLNCWEAKKCGREPGGLKVNELGVCPAATETILNGTNGGRNGGRACWAVVGTFCGGEVQGWYAKKFKNCLLCDFFRQVTAEEGPAYEDATDILTKLAVFARMR